MEWKQIKETKYEISNTGLIRRYWIKKDYKYIKPQIHVKGYLRVNTPYSAYIHRLVAEAFMPKVEGKPHVNHIDGNKQNNHYTNLEWVTIEENNFHAMNMGLTSPYSPCIAINNKYKIIAEFKGIKEARKYGKVTQIGERIILRKHLATPEYIKYVVDKRFNGLHQKVRKIRKNRSLSEDDVKWVKSNYKFHKVTAISIARKFGVSRAIIKSILSGNTYKDVK